MANTPTPTPPKNAPKVDASRCDVLGCGMIAVTSSDGSEVDAQGLGRKALPNLNVCSRHTNWPHSEDAQRFALASDVYRARK
jgi:hypothetical protein